MSSLFVKGLGLFNDQYHFGIVYIIDLIMKEEYPDHFTSTEESFLFGSMFISAAVGQIAFGILGDIYGRSKMMIVSCIILIIGGILCASVYSENTTVMIYLLIIARAILGIGIGGEYPLAVASAYESNDHSNHNEQLLNVLFIQFLAISGSLFASIMSYILIKQFVPNRLELIWRLLFIIGIIPSCLALYSRYKYRNTEPQLFIKDKHEQNIILQNMISKISNNGVPNIPINHIQNGDNNVVLGTEETDQNNPFTLKSKLYVMYKFYLKTAVATSVSWFTLDFIVYSQTICGDVIIPNTFSRIDDIALKNMIIQLAVIPAYLLGFFLVLRLFGCRRLQIGGFMGMGVVFFIIGISWDDFDKMNTNAAFMILYYISLFITNASAHITIFILPIELFPTAIRCTCYGISSSFGKVGAAIGSIFYTSFSNVFTVRAVFIAFAFFSFAGSLVTILLIRDQEKYIRYVNKHFYLNVQEVKTKRGATYKGFRNFTITETSYYDDDEEDETMYTTTEYDYSKMDYMEDTQ